MTASEPRARAQQMFGAFREPLRAKARKMRLDSKILASLGVGREGGERCTGCFCHEAQCLCEPDRHHLLQLGAFPVLEIETLQREAPHLLPYYQLIAEEASLLGGYELTSQIKRRVQQKVGRAGWKLMLRHGRRLFSMYMSATASTMKRLGLIFCNCTLLGGSDSCPWSTGGYGDAAIWQPLFPTGVVLHTAAKGATGMGAFRRALQAQLAPY